MGTSFSDRPKATENVITAPGPASDPKYLPVVPADGPASIQQLLPVSPNEIPLPPPAYNDPATPNQNTLGGDDLNDRALQTRQDDNTGQQPYAVGLYDIDEALGYYFNNVLKPTVVVNDEIVQVPVIYGSPERWSAMTNFGAYRDNKGKLILPLIMYRKVNVAKNENILFPRIDQLYYLSARKYDSKNKYDNFSSRFQDAHGKSRADKYALTSLPNYVNISYECIMWTPFVEQMNKLVEKVQFSDFSYWGDPKRFRFRIILDAFDTAVELTVDTERMVKTTFNVTLYGYILPDEFDSKSTTRISFAPKKIIFSEGNDPGTTGVTTFPFNYDADTAPANIDFNDLGSPDIDLNTLP